MSPTKTRRRVASFTQKAQALIDAADWPDEVKIVVEGQAQSDAIYVFRPGRGARTSWHLDATDLGSAHPDKVRATAIDYLERQARDPRYADKARAEDLALAQLLRGRPVFSTRPTATGNGDPEGIVITVDGHDLAGVYPIIDDDGSHAGWSLGYWDAETGEWVEDVDLTDIVAAHHQGRS